MALVTTGAMPRAIGGGPTGVATRAPSSAAYSTASPSMGSVSPMASPSPLGGPTRAPSATPSPLGGPTRTPSPMAGLTPVTTTPHMSYGGSSSYVPKDSLGPTATPSPLGGPTMGGGATPQPLGGPVRPPSAISSNIMNGTEPPTREPPTQVGAQTGWY
jgi:hypothetical protein